MRQNDAAGKGKKGRRSRAEILLRDALREYFFEVTGLKPDLGESDGASQMQLKKRLEIPQSTISGIKTDMRPVNIHIFSQVVYKFERRMSVALREIADKVEKMENATPVRLRNGNVRGGTRKGVDLNE